jgi:uncharacterized protein
MLLPITALTAAICAIMLLITAIATVRQRLQHKVAFGDGGADGLVRISRSHGNLAEHAPLAIIMIGLLEQSQANHWTLTGLATLFLVARALHIVGLHQASEPGTAPVARQAGVMGTWFVYAALIGWILYLVVTVNG